MQMDEQVAQNFSLYFWLFWTTVPVYWNYGFESFLVLKEAWI